MAKAICREGFPEGHHESRSQEKTCPGRTLGGVSPRPCLPAVPLTGSTAFLSWKWNFPCYTCAPQRRGWLFTTSSCQLGPR